MVTRDQLEQIAITREATNKTRVAWMINEVSAWQRLMRREKNTGDAQ